MAKSIFSDEESHFPSMPLVSIIVINWNGSQYIERCICSLLNLNYNNFEIIVVDNNSSDNSVEILHRYASKIKLIVNDKNYGFAKACNIGFHASKGSLIGLFNNDAVADCNWLTHLVNTLVGSNNSAAAGGPIFYANPSDKIWFSGGKVDVITGFSWHIAQMNTQLREVKEFDTLCGCAILIKKAVLEKVGYLDEGFFLYGEDIDLSFNIKRLNMHLLFVPSAISWHIVSASKKRQPSFAYKMKATCDLRLIIKDFPLQFIPTALLFKGILLPISEALCFYRNPHFLMLSIDAFLKNIKSLRSTFQARKKTEQIGKLKIENRFNETIKEAVTRIREMQLYW